MQLTDSKTATERLCELRKMLDGCRRTETVGFDTYWITADALDSSLDELEQAIAATLGRGTLTAEQVSKATYAHSIHADCADADWQAIADELNAELGSGTCELVVVERYSNTYEVINVLECSECGRTCEHVNGSYSRCPHCGRKAVKR